MVKRFLSANTSEILAMSSAELKQSIRASEGRIIVSENVAPRESFLGDVTNAEIARAFGADMILLNGIDVLKPEVFALDGDPANFVERLHELVGRPIGVNLEPVDSNAEAAETLQELPKGRQANDETLAEIERLGLEFVCFTGNPGTGVTNRAIVESVKRAKEKYSGLIMAGKMHGAGVSEPVADKETIIALVEAGADIILVPSVGSVPGFDSNQLKEAVKVAHAAGALVMTAIGTSQEGSSAAVIERMAVTNKICGVDMQHIGDAGFGGLAPVENIFAMSKAIRGHRHAVSMMAKSVNR